MAWLRQIHVQAVVTVIDAVLGARTLDDMAEARRQVAVADRMILTKVDIAGEEASAELEAGLAGLNPAARIVRADNGHVPAETILADNAALTEPIYPPRTRARHTGEVDSFAMRFDRPLDWAAIEQAFELLARLRGADILRAKGLIDIKGCKGPVVVHQVQHLTAKPVELEGWPNGEPRLAARFHHAGDRQAGYRAIVRHRDPPSRGGARGAIERRKRSSRMSGEALASRRNRAAHFLVTGRGIPSGPIQRPVL